MTHFVQDYKSYTVSAQLPPGKCVIKSASHPTDVYVNREVSWYVVGEVRDGYVNNPGVSYRYYGGPSNSIKLVDNAGNKKDLPIDCIAVVYRKGTQPPGTTIDSRDMYRGVIFPQAGTYTIWLCAGYVSDTEAAAGSLVVGDLYTITLHPEHIVMQAGVPLTIEIPEPMEVGIGLLMAAAPLIVAGGVVGYNELIKAIGKRVK